MLTVSRDTARHVLCLLGLMWWDTLWSVQWPITQMVFAVLVILCLIKDEYTGVNAVHEELRELDHAADHLH